MNDEIRSKEKLLEKKIARRKNVFPTCVGVFPASTAFLFVIVSLPHMRGGVSQAELERLQTVPPGYTSTLKRNEAACLLGDGWTVDVIAHIFSFM